jgi:alcohol dehydrogenase class IV
MAEVHQFNYPTTILYGAGCVAALGERLSPGGRYLLVTDPGLVSAGVAPRVEASLRDSGIEVVRHADVHGNPIEADVTSGVERYRDADAQGIIALGGGSPMDVAKAIAVLVNHEGPLVRFDDSAGGDKLIVEPVPPIYAIATTAGTGSEVGRSAVIITKEHGVKTVIFHPSLLPTIAVLDPELTVGLPPRMTAATGMDAFAHGLETYLARGFHPMADSIALGCMELVIKHLPRAVEEGSDLEARGNMLIAATMGATAFQKGLGVVHSLAHPLSTRYGIHHGLANALLMPRVLRWQLENKQADFTDDLRARYTRVASLFPPIDAELDPGDLPVGIDQLNHRVGLKGNLAELGLRKEDIGALADEALADPCHHSNPIAMTRDDLAAIYEYCL